MTTEIRYFTKEEALAAVTQNGRELKYCTPDIQNNEDVVLTALKKDSWYFCYASDELRSSKTFIMKALLERIAPWGLIEHASIIIQSDIEIIALVIEKSDDGWEFCRTKGEVTLNKELAAKALVKYAHRRWGSDLALWEKLHPTLKEFFPKDCWYEKAKTYLCQLEQEKQAKSISGGCTEEDEVVW